MIIEADNSLNSLRNRRSKSAQAGVRSAYVFPLAIPKGDAHAHAPPPTVRHWLPPSKSDAINAGVALSKYLASF